jgi:hypothetical protein
MQQQVRLTPGQETELVERYRAGALRLELASAYGIHKSTVTDIVGRHEAQRTRGLTEPEAARAVEMYRTGASLVDVGNAFGVNATTIRNNLMKLGVARRDTQGRPN